MNEFWQQLKPSFIVVLPPVAAIMAGLTIILWIVLAIAHERWGPLFLIPFSLWVVFALCHYMGTKGYFD